MNSWSSDGDRLGDHCHRRLLDDEPGSTFFFCSSQSHILVIYTNTELHNSTSHTGSCYVRYVRPAPLRRCTTPPPIDAAPDLV